MRISTALLQVSYAIPLVYAGNSETFIFFETQSQVRNPAKLMDYNDGKQMVSYSTWSETSYCYPFGEPLESKLHSCDNLPIYTYFDSRIIKPGTTIRIAIKVPEYKLDVSCVDA
jgi:hypothetical protein